jgi:hypothetical protein
MIGDLLTLYKTVYLISAKKTAKTVEKRTGSLQIFTNLILTLKGQCHEIFNPGFLH